MVYAIVASTLLRSSSKVGHLIVYDFIYFKPHLNFKIRKASDNDKLTLVLPPEQRTESLSESETKGRLSNNRK